MNQELVSIIVTVYNIEHYLPYCLNSINNQTYKELDIVLVDDGSTDSSGIICDNYALNDNRCHVVHQKNQGACMARNVGKKEAKGNYLYFMDGDDYMHHDAIRVMYEAINSESDKYDIAIIGHKRTESFTENTLAEGDNSSYLLDGYNLMLKLMGGIDEMELAGYCWNKLYRKSAVESLSFRQFVPMEDFDFNLRVFLNTRQAIIIPRILYYYVQRPTSLVHSPKKSWFVWSRLTELLYQNYKELNDTQRHSYGSLLIGKLYFIMLFYKDTTWKTDHQVEAFSLCNDIEKNTIRAFLISRHISLIKKLYRLLLLHSPMLTRLMMQRRGWKR
jgi:glycosyltransferase involved in cell wall biosynthesis